MKEIQFKSGESLSLSYAWAEEENRDSSGYQLVDRFCKLLERNSVQFVRDTRNLENGESISKFVKTIGEADNMVLFLSDSYLKSFSCMSELLTAFYDCKRDYEKLSSKLIVFLMESCPDLRKLANRRPYLDYWENVFEEESPEGNRLPPGMAPEAVARLQNITDIQLRIDGLLARISDTSCATSFQELKDWMDLKEGEESSPMISEKKWNGRLAMILFALSLVLGMGIWFFSDVPFDDLPSLPQRAAIAILPLFFWVIFLVILSRKAGDRLITQSR